MTAHASDSTRPESAPARRGFGRAVVVAALAVLLGQAACRRTAPEPESRPDPPGTAVASAAVAAPSVRVASVGGPAPETGDDASFRFPPAERVVAVGDIHGDLDAARRALRLAGAVDARDRWIGGKLVLVQTGDEIDRGDGDRAVIDLFVRLDGEARAAGGRVHALSGNHEAMNVAGDFRYVTPGGFAAFADVDARGVPADALGSLPASERGRAAAFFPGGPYAKILSERPVAVAVGDTVFVHGGITADHVRYGLGRLNREVRAWMTGDGAPPPLVEDPEGPLWTRRYSDERGGIDCSGLTAALAALGAKRMVVGHTPHESGIASGCDGRVWWIDTGLSAYYGGPTEVLELRGSTAVVLRGP
jgi:hypothetical protein